MPCDSILTLFEDMYQKYFRRIYNYAYMRLLSREAAEDAVQDVFLAAFAALDRFDPTRGLRESGTYFLPADNRPSMAVGSGGAWLSKIAANRVTDLQKRAYRYREVSVGEVPEAAFEGSFDEGGTLRNPVNQRVYRILKKLSEGERELLALRYEMELTNEEIAEHMGLSVNAVSHRYSRLLAKCRRIDGET